MNIILFIYGLEWLSEGIEVVGGLSWLSVCGSDGVMTGGACGGRGGAEVAKSDSNKLNVSEIPIILSTIWWHNMQHFS